MLFADFETALADFEIELLQSELPPDEDFFICTRRPIKHRVQFDDNPSIFEDTRSTSYDDSPTSISSTPRRRYELKLLLFIVFKKNQIIDYSSKNPVQSLKHFNRIDSYVIFWKNRKIKSCHVKR